MLTRKTAFGIGVLIILMGLIIGGVLSGQKKPIRKTNGGSSKSELKTMTVQNRDVPLPFEVGGSLQATDRIEIYAEVSGILHQAARPFKAGITFAAGEVLVKIDDEVYRNNLLAEKSNLLNQLTLLLPDLAIDFPDRALHWERYLNEFDLEKPLPPLPETSDDRERNYIAARNIFGRYYGVKSMEATLAKYTLKAPYDGVVTASDINPGMLVRSGQRLGEFTNTEEYELEASVGLNKVQYLRQGDKVVLTSDDIAGEFDGTIRRINRKIDPSSQSVRVYIATGDQRLKDGMYITAHINSGVVGDAVKIPRSLLIENSRLYVIDAATLKLLTVDVIEKTNDHVIVRGLPDGTVILAEAFPDAYDGMALDGIILK